MNLRPLYVRSKHRVRAAVYHVPWIYLPLASLKQTDEDGSNIVTAATDLVVEAFPRSGNTFAVSALRLSQTKRLNIAHHYHAPAQLIKAAQLGKPALLIVRQPKDAVLSHVLRRPGMSIDLGLKSWISFHRVLRPYSGSFVTATFDQLTTDFGVIIEKVNRRFDTAFPPFLHTKENVEACFSAIEVRNAEHSGGSVDEARVSRPSPTRQMQKQALEEQWHLASLAPDRKAADELYLQYEELMVS